MIRKPAALNPLVPLSRRDFQRNILATVFAQNERFGQSGAVES
jgi:hypothetical protein